MRKGKALILAAVNSRRIIVASTGITAVFITEHFLWLGFESAANSGGNDFRNYALFLFLLYCLWMAIPLVNALVGLKSKRESVVRYCAIQSIIYAALLSVAGLSSLLSTLEGEPESDGNPLYLLLFPSLLLFLALPFLVFFLASGAEKWVRRRWSERSGERGNSQEGT